MANEHLNGVMFDIETMGTLPGCVVLSIGAVRFDVGTGKIHDEFYVNIDPKDSIKHGLTHDKDTLQWWMKPENATAWKTLAKDKRTAEEGLGAFFDYVSRGPKKEKVWCWGAQFDPVITEAAFMKVLGKRTPWHYCNIMCARTISNAFGVKIERGNGTHHNALDDAKSQAQYLIDLFGESEDGA